MNEHRWSVYSLIEAQQKPRLWPLYLWLGLIIAALADIIVRSAT